MMLCDGGYRELVATVAGQGSATLDRFPARGPRFWPPDSVTHPNHGVSPIEAGNASGAPAETTTRLSGLTGAPAEPDPMGGYRIPLTRGCLGVLPRAAAASLFPAITSGPPLIGLTIGIQPYHQVTGGSRPVGAVIGRSGHAGWVAIRVVTARE
jgi:hypothetical protein